MKIRLALATAPVSLEERYGAFAGAANTEPSFGLACLGAVARRAGADVRVIEAAACNLGLASTAEQILAHAPHVVGLTATTSGIEAAAALAARIKRDAPDTLTLIGGCHATALPDATLNAYPAFDRVVMREGEATLEALLTCIAEGRPLHGQLGTAERRDGRIVVNPPRDPVADLDSLPLPAWDLLQGFPGSFRPSPARIRRWPCASVVLTRGCPNACTFCDRSVFGRHCRAYSPEYAVSMIEDLYNNYGVREVLIEDDTFIIARQRVEAFCQLLIEKQIGITWSCLGRADRVTPELLKLMRRAGCWHISYGIESGDPAILKQVNKNLDLPQIHKALTWSRAAGLRTKGFFMIGFPGETPETIDATRRVACSLPLDDISVMLLSPFPGCELYETAADHGVFERDWRRMTTIEAVFIPEGFTKDALEQARARLLRSFYLRPGLLLRMGTHLLFRPRALWATLKGFGAFVNVIRKA